MLASCTYILGLINLLRFWGNWQSSLVSKFWLHDILCSSFVDLLFVDLLFVSPLSCPWLLCAPCSDYLPSSLDTGLHDMPSPFALSHTGQSST